MPEVLPNWHPVAVHFPIALALIATLLLLASRLRPANPTLVACARLLLALAAGAAVLAAALGWQAYLTVDHDAAGHRVMVQHRNWAMASMLGLVLLALWDAWRQRAEKAVHGGLLPAMLLISGGLCVTGWLGGEMVFRHGVGVSPAAFATPPPPAEEQPPAAASAPAAAPAAPVELHGEHVHKDGKRHHH
ncbi:MAG TPA: DUF2231 domain-containing protein [Azonexus sp.]|nr:DUF2231 domain-containing protein [Azonexus sp.]